MRLGPIICDPYSEGARALMGKNVVVADTYGAITDGDGRFGTLVLLSAEGFTIGDMDEKPMPFVREAIEDETWRPYRSVAELVKDFKERFMKKTIHDAFMPLVWVRDSDGSRWMVNGFDDEKETLVHVDDTWISLSELLEGYTYLDGSHCGIKVPVPYEITDQEAAAIAQMGC